MNRRAFVWTLVGFAVVLFALAIRMHVDILGCDESARFCADLSPWVSAAGFVVALLAGIAGIAPPGGFVARSVVGVFALAGLALLGLAALGALGIGRRAAPA